MVATSVNCAAAVGQVRHLEIPLEVVLADYDALSQSKLVAMVLQQSCFDLYLERVRKPCWLMAQPRVEP